MSPELAGRVAQVREALEARPGAWLVGLAGIPGSGKTTLSEALCGVVPGAVALPMDGYHLHRRDLDREGLRRRGAPHTFDRETFRSDLESLRRTKSGSFPAFDHAVKDPEPDAVRIGPRVPLVVVEGLYLLLRDWRLAGLFDLTVFIDCDFEEAMRRTAWRHLECGIVETVDDGLERVRTSDSLNARLILADGCRERADVVVT